MIKIEKFEKVTNFNTQIDIKIKFQITKSNFT